MNRVRRLVGPIAPEQLRHVDWAIARGVGVFVPVAGPCGYAITAEHVHPAWSFVVPFDDRGRVRIDGRTVPARAGRLYAYGPGVPHTELLDGEASRYAAVFVAPDVLRRALRHYGEAPLPAGRAESVPAPTEIVVSVREMLLEQSTRLPGGEAVRAAVGQRLVHLILRALLGVPDRGERVPERAAILRAAELADGPTGTAFRRAFRMAPSRYRAMLRRQVGRRRRV